ncbi:PREDICTED: RNA-binding protein 5-B isoform X1 [Rhagoletis zephyria]|uniref:RNA-binding protein 5-B isoform X1 n=1 Tax=Rhagoletis zephyria TaxID=28612 RepID=UPI000811223F|nr:PREDICTED: RNA-binding protein 5-B isoform X1 [Rhagoletis zephyria]
MNMDRRSRSISPGNRRHRNGGNMAGGGPRRDYRRYSRSRSRSRSRERSRDQNFRRRNTRSRSRDRMGPHRRGGSVEKDLYRDLIYDDYQEDKSYNNRGHRGRGGGGGGGIDDDYADERERFWNERARDKGRDYERERDRERDYDRDRDRRDTRHNRYARRYENDHESDDSDESLHTHFYNKTPSNTIIVLGLQSHITEADLMSILIQQGMTASIRLIRKRQTGASRGFAFVEFSTIDEAARWMELTQGSLQLPDQSCANLQYSVSPKQKVNVTDWHCFKCGVLNFKRRDICFKCYASRGDSEKIGEGSEEVSNILTKKIMLRNLDTLTTEETVLTAMQQHVPELAGKITKILVSRDTLTQTSRGICYLNFDSLIDSMNLYSALKALDPPLTIDGRQLLITYCIDHENRQIVPKKNDSVTSSSATVTIGPMTAAEMMAASGSLGAAGAEYTLADVPRLAEYSAALYASTPAEHAHYLQYYTEYYIGEINKGHYGNLPSVQVEETSANSAAAVALSAIQRKQKKMNSIETTATQAAAAAAAAAAAVKASLALKSVVTPKGNDGKTYPTPDVTLYQYDETSGYYYDPTTGLYYDAHSQYYYNSETGAYLYWDQRKSTYVLATPAAAAATVQDVVKSETGEDGKTGNSAAGSTAATATAANEDEKKEKKDSTNKHDKVKVAKKIVKDMEKWAKQLNQKKDYTVVATPQPILPSKSDDAPTRAAGAGAGSSGHLSSGYADVGFSILEKKERTKLVDYMPTPAIANKLTAYASDSDEEHAALGPSTSAGGSNEASEKDYVDFQKLTCLLCKRAFQSLEILQKHLKISNLHKENLQKFQLARGASGGGDSMSVALSNYRDRAKERRQKYGESDPPVTNRSRERFEMEMKSVAARQPEAPPMPIGSNNVGNRLLQKMGWSEGQGLGRKNQGRTSIIEAEARSSTVGLGNKSGITPGEDYKTYIKKMMKSRYESA